MDVAQTFPETGDTEHEDKCKTSLNVDSAGGGVKQYSFINGDKQFNEVEDALLSRSYLLDQSESIDGSQEDQIHQFNLRNSEVTGAEDAA